MTPTTRGRKHARSSRRATSSKPQPSSPSTRQPAGTRRTPARRGRMKRPPGSRQGWPNRPTDERMPKKLMRRRKALWHWIPTHVRARLRPGQGLCIVGRPRQGAGSVIFTGGSSRRPVARDARKAHARLSPQRNPMGSPPSTRTRLRRLAAAQHLAALGLAPEQCSTPNVKTAHRTIVARVDTKSKQPQTAATRARLRAAQEAYDTLVDGASREICLEIRSYWEQGRPRCETWRRRVRRGLRRADGHARRRVPAPPPEGEFAAETAGRGAFNAEESTVVRAVRLFIVQSAAAIRQLRVDGAPSHSGRRQSPRRRSRTEPERRGGTPAERGRGERASPARRPAKRGGRPIGPSAEEPRTPAAAGVVPRDRFDIAPRLRARGGYNAGAEAVPRSVLLEHVVVL